MRILFLTPRVPYPPNKGEKTRWYQHVRHLSESHEVHLVSFVDRPEDAQWAGTLSEFCRTVNFVPLRPAWALLRGGRGLLEGRPLSETYFGGRAVRMAVQRAAAETFDVGWAASSVMAQYLPLTGAEYRVADFVDLDSEKWRQFAPRSPAPLRWGYRLEATRLRGFERRVGAAADCVLFASAEEAAAYHPIAPAGARVEVIPTGVDTTFFTPARTRPVVPPTILFTGTLDYRPNTDAVRFFLRDVFPLIRREVPAAQFVAVGHRPPSRLRSETRSFAGAARIDGSVPDIRPYFAAAHVYVAPLRLGRGVKTKVLEAMATGLPIVASPVAVEGLAVTDHTHAIVAQTPADFAAAVVALLRDPQRRRWLAQNALRLVQDRYACTVTGALLDACLEAYAQSGGATDVRRATASRTHG